MSNDVESVELPISTFPPAERRRIAADYVQTHPEAGVRALILPRDIRLALDGHDEAVRRSRMRQAKGFCSEDESQTFRARSDEALAKYLDKQVDAGRLLPLERQLIERNAVK